MLNKLSKEKGCEVTGRWRKVCVRHFCWAVTSTQSKLGDVMLAKFGTFLSHVMNMHQDLPSRLFNKCVHGPITAPKVWLTKSKEFIVSALQIWNEAIILVCFSPNLPTSLLFSFFLSLPPFSPLFPPSLPSFPPLLPSPASLLWNIFQNDITYQIRDASLSIYTISYMLLQSQ